VNVTVNNLCFKGYRGNNINNVNIELSTGQCLIISGISGCGKSLLLSLICGLVIADSGSVVFDDLTMQQMTTEQDAHFRKRLGVIFQKPALLSNLTILENLLLPLIQHCPELSAVSKAGERASLILGCLVVPLVHQYFPTVDLLITGVVGGSLGFFLGRVPVVRSLLS